MKLVRAVSCALLFATLFTSQTLGAQEDEAKLSQLRAELENLTRRLKNYQSERDGIQTDLRQQELQLSNIHRQIYDTNRNMATSQSRLAALQKQAAGFEKKRRTQEEQLRKDLGAMYRTGTEEPLKMLLNQTDPADFSRMLTYYQYLLEARASSIEVYLQTIADLGKSRADILQQQERLEVLSENLATQETSLAFAKVARQKLLDQVESRILSAEQLIAEKEDDRQKLEALITEVEEQIASLAPPDSYKPFASLKGQYSWPVRGNLAHRYGTTRNGTLRWQGAVIRAAAGEPITTIHHGRVVFADYLRGYGLLVIVDHDDDYLTLYGHNQSLFVEPGDWVAPGDQIALVGNSGGISEQGLYFEIRYQGKPQNPSSWTHR